MTQDLEKARIRNRRYAAKNRELLNAKSRAWYAANKEHAAATRRVWRELNAEKDRADIARYQAGHKEHLALKAKEWNAQNPEKRKASVARYREKDPAKVLALQAAWRRANRDKVNAKKSRRIASKLQATPAWADPVAIREKYEAARAAVEIFGEAVHVDHIVPLRSKFVCGLHCEANLRLLPGKANQQKSNRYWPDMPESLAA